MKIKSARRPIFLQLCALAVALATFHDLARAQTARAFSHPDRIRYDSRCLTIDGRDVFIYSGSFHYFRCPKALWPDRFQKIKDAGFNCIEAYIAWNWCEPQMPSGLNDFSKVHLQDFDDFLTMAEKYGLYVIARPGPYICAEWDTGGYPQWLLNKRPDDPSRHGDWLRGDDPVYLAWCKHWYDEVCPVIAKHQITRKPPGSYGVILMQVENEYDYAHFPDDVKIAQVKALAKDAWTNGIDVPLITCWTHQVRGSQDPVLRQIFDCCNFYPRWNVNSVQKSIEELRREQPDAPLATTELQGGWFSQVGGKLSQDQEGVTAAQINNLTLFAIQNGESILNYYMLFGGTNPGDRAARDVTATYDYDAPIREWGGVDAKYQHVWALGHMLREHGADLARSVTVDCDVTTSQKDVTVVERRAPDGGRYLFVRTSQHTEPRTGTAHVKEQNSTTPELVFDYQLEPFGSKILYLPPRANDATRGEWLPKAAPAFERPTNVPAGVTITSVRTCDDPGPAHWTKWQTGKDLAQAGIYDSRFIFYKANISSATPTNLLVEFPASDVVLATINGKRADRIGGTSASSAFALPAGSSKVELLYENLGHANGGSAMEHPCGIQKARLASATFDTGKPVTGWRMHAVNGTSNRPEIKAGFDDHDWKPVAVDALDADNLPAGQSAVYRANMDVSAADLRQGKLILTFGRIDDFGWIYVNGKRVGQTADWAREYDFDVTRQIHPGANVIAVVVKNNDGAGGLGKPSFAWKSKTSTASLAAFGSPAGVEHQWWQPNFKDSDWKTVAIGNDADSASDDSMLKWYRMNFQLPAAESGVWVPWHVSLNVNGNGFLYLNGHAIGRYWETGPQHDFFLPECWLHFGPGQTNNLTLSLRPLEKGASIQSAVVEPYAGFAERR